MNKEIEIRNEINERFKNSFNIQVVKTDSFKLLVIYSNHGIITDFEIDFISKLAKRNGLMYYISWLETLSRLYIAIKLNEN